jgi:hypothetical protein
VSHEVIEQQLRNCLHEGEDDHCLAMAGHSLGDNNISDYYHLSLINADLRQLRYYGGKPGTTAVRRNKRNIYSGDALL